eukprot:CAMPEP_0170488480 /NCGR_PEP_ID=MMETSP0208-20121228/7034_1 /TAXON_ID=197538 /ORGANISM="Strombidium inclinatum, Strain S3" /LENGTH=133 /DNA_ID=CAMNT_0010763069 /DNA_START=156 /DNA_END=557 /DNA_ORIENTATION=-
MFGLEGFEDGTEVTILDDIDYYKGVVQEGRFGRRYNMIYPYTEFYSVFEHTMPPFAKVADLHLSWEEADEVANCRKWDRGLMIERAYNTWTHEMIMNVVSYSPDWDKFTVDSKKDSFLMKGLVRNYYKSSAHY